MISKYGTRWQTYDGRHLILEDMDTNHLLNCYKHILNNFGFYTGLEMGQTGCTQKQAEQSVLDMRKEFKRELLSRGISNDMIEDWQEETWRIKV